MATRKAKAQTLTDALAQLLQKRLLPDLSERAAQPSIKASLERLYASEQTRTADNLREFTERTLEQVGAAWILSCVFVRTLEDRGLLARNRLAGEGAQDSEQLFFELAPSLTARDYLLTVFQEVASLPGAEDVLGVKHNAAFKLSPSNDGARALLDFFRERDASGGLRWQFAGEDTRFLGDLYQDLSEQVRKRYALLQTPVFVESFILDHTLEPAIAEYGLEQVRIIDPTCGSGHFLLGAFRRLLDQRLSTAPGVDVREHALAALGQVYGVDLNPYAVAIARFRLTLAYLARCGFTQLAQAPRLQLNLVVADSLLHGAKDTTLLFAEHESAHGDEEAWDAQLFALDEPGAARLLFGQRYHAVVGNPPYITPKDAALRDAYRSLYRSCYRGYALAAPFTERFFQLAVDGGFVGMINANSFMKREFGTVLIEQVLPHVDLTRVIDTAYADIPGHGTPTVLLFGRNRKPVGTQVRTVLGRKQSPVPAEDPKQGAVWRSIVDHGDSVGFENEYVSVVEMLREKLNRHPWSLSGGGAAEVKALLESHSDRALGDVVAAIGRTTVVGHDDVWIAPVGTWDRRGISLSVIPLVVGEVVRDWSIWDAPEVLYPYDRMGGEPVDSSHALVRVLWPWRRVLETRTVFGKEIKSTGRLWWEHLEHYSDKLVTPLSITFAFVSSRNHFVLDRGGKVFNRTAPIIKLPESASEDDHLALLAYLNSSTACFWMKQVSQNRTNASQKHSTDPARATYEFAGTALAELPVFVNDPRLVEFGRELCVLGEQRSKWLSGGALLADESNLLSTDALHHALEAGWLAYDRVTERAVFLQEELDWLVYEQAGLLEGVKLEIRTDSELIASLGARPFEREEGYNSGVSERASKSDDQLTSASGGAPAHWRGRDTLGSHEAIQTLETRQYKRAWRDTDSNVDQREFRRTLPATWLRGDLLRRLEQAFDAPTILNARSAAARIRGPVLTSVAEYLTEDVATLVERLLAGDAVPFTASSIYTDSGRKKRAEWQQVWQLQRAEDDGESVGDIPIPPPYSQGSRGKSTDFSSGEFWRLRGPLDVPKERFISYPGCEKDGDPSPLIGWAGWNHLQRAQALIALYQERKTEDGWQREQLMPMLVGLHELMFWLELWHSAPEAGSQNPAREFKQYMDAELSAHRLTVSDLEAWRPPAKKTGKGAKKGK